MGLKKRRQENVIARLESQLSSGEKTAKKSTTKVKLTDSDKKRIEKEIETLKKRV